MLNGYRALDVCAEQGMFCGYVLAHLDCEVIAVEPPGGSPARQAPPLVNRKAGSSLWWQAYARGKRSVELDIESSAGRERFLDMVAQTDFLIAPWPDARAERLGLGYEALSKLNPGLIMVCITPFGSAGPKADWSATDLTVWAASGAHILSGDADRAPVRTSVPQSFLHAGVDAAGGALIALHERHRSGLGQLVDVSAQASSAQATLAANLVVHNDGGPEIQREAGGLRGLYPLKLTWPCQDGYVAITLMFGPAFDEPNRRLLRWIHEHGCCDAATVEKQWGQAMLAMAAGETPPEPYFELCRQIERFTLPRTQQDLFEEGLSRGIYIAPAVDTAGLLGEPHFHARDYWQSLSPQSGSGDGIRVPGAFAKFSATPLQVLDPAPTLGEAEVGERDLPGSTPAAQTSGLPLQGLKVLDFMWVIAGPFFTRVLAEYGATVIEVESSERLDPARSSPPFVNAEPGVENSTLFANFNAGKLGLTIDPSNPVGREVLLDLVRWADVVTESFSPKAMKAWGLDYATLKTINPSLVMLSSCLMGQTGPRSLVPGYGNMAAALTGFYDLTGWKDRSPAGPYLAYTDGVSPKFMLVSLLAALEHRRRTGEGQHVDLSQAEAAIHLLAPAVLDHEINDHVWHRMGNRDLGMAPHGVYPTQGEDRWIAIACQSDQAWPALCETMELTAEAADPELAAASGRLQRQDELDECISAWTAAQEGSHIQSLLLDAGVAAHVVQNSRECAGDPQLEHRRHFVPVSHGLHEKLVVEGSRVKLSRTPGVVERGGPLLGEHNFHVLKDVLGYDDDRIADIYASLAME